MWHRHFLIKKSCFHLLNLTKLAKFTKKKVSKTHSLLSRIVESSSGWSSNTGWSSIYGKYFLQSRLLFRWIDKNWVFRMKRKFCLILFVEEFFSPINLSRNIRWSLDSWRYALKNDSITFPFNFNLQTRKSSLTIFVLKSSHVNLYQANFCYEVKPGSFFSSDINKRRIGRSGT